MAYNLNQVAMITGLTARTLQNHLKQGILSGEKINGVWSFTEEALNEYIAHPSVKQVIHAKHHSVVFDFLDDSFKKTNRICTIMDFPVSADEALSIASFFSSMISSSGNDIEFRFINEKNLARFILSGSEEQVCHLMKAYYAQDSAADSNE